MKRTILQILDRATANGATYRELGNARTESGIAALESLEPGEVELIQRNSAALSTCISGMGESSARELMAAISIFIRDKLGQGATNEDWVAVGQFVEKQTCQEGVVPSGEVVDAYTEWLAQNVKQDKGA